VVAISTESVERAREAADYYGLEFALLSDPDLEAVGAYGLFHEDGGIGGDVARPATLVVDQRGDIVWRELTDNWRVRPRVEDVLEVLRTVD